MKLPSAETIVEVHFNLAMLMITPCLDRMGARFFTRRRLVGKRQFRRVAANAQEFFWRPVFYWEAWRFHRLEYAARTLAVLVLTRFSLTVVPVMVTMARVVVAAMRVFCVERGC